MSDWLVNQLTAAFGSYSPATHTLGTMAVSARLN
jgi:hypothetical protein